jgi:hypothetical protein
MERKRQPTTPLRDIRRESRARPPERSQIEALPFLGQESLAFNLSGLAMRFEGLDDPLAEASRRRFRAYLCGPGDASSFLRVSVHADPIDYYVRPDRGERPEGYYRLHIVHHEQVIRMVTYSMAAWIDLARARAGLAFGAGEFDPRERALENFCRVAVAWSAVDRGGFLVHGASIVREGRGYIFFGKSASGKSTLASLTPEGRVISDDLSLVLPGPDGPVVAGSPFRGTYRAGDPVIGTFPLAGMFRLVQDDRTYVETPDRMYAFAEYVANLPFVNDALHAYPKLLDTLEVAVTGLPIMVLHFRKQPDFWPAVDAALQGLEPTGS